eukprot:15057309-Alexandrium_andersonii.AAC.1
MTVAGSRSRPAKRARPAKRPRQHRRPSGMPRIGGAQTHSNERPVLHYAASKLPETTRCIFWRFRATSGSFGHSRALPGNLGLRPKLLESTQKRPKVTESARQHPETARARPKLHRAMSGSFRNCTTQHEALVARRLGPSERSGQPKVGPTIQTKRATGCPSNTHVWGLGLDNSPAMAGLACLDRQPHRPFGQNVGASRSKEPLPPAGASGESGPAGGFCPPGTRPTGVSGAPEVPIGVGYKGAPVRPLALEASVGE